MHQADFPGLSQTLVSHVSEARRAAPSILFIPNIHLWWPTYETGGSADACLEALQQLLTDLIDGIPETLPVLIVSTVEIPSSLESLPIQLIQLASQCEGYSTPLQDLVHDVAVNGLCVLTGPTEETRTKYVDGKCVP